MPASRTRPLSLAIACLLAGLPAAALAQDEHHDPAVDLDRVVVRATPLAATAEDLAQPVEVLAGKALDDARASSLGETVDGLPGVQSSSFGPGVGRPIIRGMDGARVQVLSDGLGSGDVSTVSADQAGNARRAARTARSASSALPPGILPMTSSVAALMTSATASACARSSLSLR